MTEKDNQYISVHLEPIYQNAALAFSKNRVYHRSINLVCFFLSLYFFPYLVSFGRAQWKQYYPYWMTLESTVEDIFNAMFRRQCAVFTCICGLSNSLQYKIRCNVATTIDRNNATFFKKKRESARGGDWTHDGRVAFKGLFERSLAQKLRKPNVAISTKL